MIEKNELEFITDWLSLDSYSFRILTITTILADNKRAYRGTLAQFCESMNIQPSSINKNKIKATLEFLAANDYIKLIVDKTIYTISLAAAVEKNPEIIKIKKAWYILIRKNSGKVEWGNILKVFLSLLEISPDKTITYREIGGSLGLSVSTIERCIKTLCSINFEDFQFKKTPQNKKDAEGNYFCIGQTYEKVINFE